MRAAIVLLNTDVQEDADVCENVCIDSCQNGLENKNKMSAKAIRIL